MKFQHIRNATALLDYADKRLLIDPMFAPKHGLLSAPAFTGNTDITPLVDLPVPVEEIMAGIDAVIVTHTHPDHWDRFAAQALDKSLPIFVQSSDDQKLIQSQGFQDVRVLSENEPAAFGNLSMFKTPGHHGTQDQVLRELGVKLGLQLAIDQVMGVIFKHTDEKTLYLAGDTVWYDGLAKTIASYKPEVIIVNGSAARMIEGDALTMTVSDIEQVALKAPLARIIAVHYGAVNHYTQTRDDLDQYASEKGFRNRIEIPEDGESFQV
ncbi:metal-dependent hydrolase [Streptococcus criceti]|uniref:Metallo-beta-lactamase domain-containing protein n=1 Tax=Streptococcus criceti HS-6 TaxID=873449 RepID=G5JNY9_STRCG|nr:MBL fold metallo-hydrolase [Streptococcus criceti]EHI73979.1 hypothetical protein STRCR_1520 [Streptococcus criceti HS-6]SUN43400.1 metal-dependent hydrolase [Streptococcus criceti]